MSEFGLLGNPLGHSWSPQIHALLGDYPYVLYEIAPPDLAAFLADTDLAGMNVTIPYKKEVMRFCTSLSDRARRIGSVNTLLKTPGGWYGDNTDHAGFISMVDACGVSPAGKKTLVFGSGGASLAVIEALKDLGADPIVNISRSGADNYENLHHHFDAEFLVNATPLGMYPNVDLSPVSVSLFPNCKCVLDVVYNPTRTKLLAEAENLGIPFAGGLVMLVSQACRASEIFTGKKIPDTVITEITDIMNHRMQNIVLIGMPGCGKSTVAGSLAEKTGRTLLDTDALIAERAGRSIPEIFRAEGEPSFRAMETAILKEAGMRSGCVIATGGGCVTVPENYQHLHRNSVIFWLKRDISLLPTNGRPISQRTPVGKLYETRAPLYRLFSDHEIDNNGDVSHTVESILEVFKL